MKTLATLIAEPLLFAIILWGVLALGMYPFICRPKGKHRA